MEKYEGSISVEFVDIPSVRLQTIISLGEASLWERLALATKRRFFTLDTDWFITLEDFSKDPNLNGKIKIPDVDDNGNKIIFDGASIPLPWLVSLLTIGILRPLGVMLIASIIHDYAYKFGCLKKEDGTVIKVERHIADYLLRDIIGTVNRLSLVGYIGWFFVRVGWLFVKYNNQYRGGEAPVGVYLLFTAIISFLIWIGITNVLMYGMIFYIAFYLMSLYVLKREKHTNN